MTVQELRDLLDQAATLPWILDADDTQNNVVSADDDHVTGKLWPHDAALIVAAVNALPKLLDVWEAAREVASTYAGELEAIEAGTSGSSGMTNPETSLTLAWFELDGALNRLGETP